MNVDAQFISTLIVVGMTCGHCTRSVTEELSEIDGVRSVDVDLASGAVTVRSDRELDHDELDAAIVEAGFILADRA